MSGRALRILVTCDWFSPDSGGGAERVAFEVSRRLTGRGHHVTILATRPAGQRAFELPPGIDLRVVRAFSLSRMLRAQMSLAPGLVAATGRIIRATRPDIVLGHSLQFQTTPFAAAAARRQHVPFVVTAHIADLRDVPGPIGVAARAHEATIGRAILRLATGAIAVSDAVAAHVRSLAPTLPTDVVPNGVDLSRFRPRVEAPHDDLRVGFLGRLVSNKGPDVAVRAVADAIRIGLNASLFVAGDGPERTNLARLAGSLGIPDRVHLQGYLPDPEAWFRGIDVLVRPSLTEGMPLSVLEAMAAGTPVIASDVPGNASLLRQDETGLLVPTGDHRALAHALVRIHHDEALRGRLREGARQAVSVLSWDRTAELTEGALERAIIRSQQPRLRS